MLPKLRDHCQKRERRSEACEAEATDDTLGYRAPALRRHDPSPFDQFSLLRSIDYVALAKRLPIKAVRFVENYFVDLGFASCTLRGAEEDTYARLEPETLFGAQNNGGMLAGSGEFPIPHFPRFHQSSQEGLPWAEVAADSTRSHSFSHRR